MTSAATPTNLKNKKTKPKKKKSIKKMVFLGVVGFISLILWWGFQPFRGTIEYGVCKVFAELKVSYPSTFQTLFIQNFDQSVRIYYSHLDGYGQSRSEFIECSFRPDPNTGFAIESVKINRTAISQDEIENFNRTIPAILANPPDLVLPSYEDLFKNLEINDLGKPIL